MDWVLEILWELLWFTVECLGSGEDWLQEEISSKPHADIA